MQLETGTIIIISFASACLWFWGIYEIIKSATKSTKQSQFSEMQVRLLAELLLKQGVSVDRIMEIINLEKKYFKDSGNVK